MIAVSGVGYEPVGAFLDGERALVPDVTLLELLCAGVLASDAGVRQANGRWEIEGDPTEGALVVVAAKAGIDRGFLNQQLPRTAEIPFSSERRRMTTLHNWASALVAYSEGAADVIVDGCTYRMNPSGETLLTPSARASYRTSNAEWQVMASVCSRSLASTRVLSRMPNRT